MAQKSRGVALVIVLCFVVLLTGVVVAYFSLAMSSRQLSNSSFNIVAADELARSALEVVKGDLKAEITSGSTVWPAPNPNNYPVSYSPLASANMVPKRNISVTQSLIMRSLVSRSDRADTKTRASAVNSSTDSSQNGRAISRSRWNKHYLLPRPTGAALGDTTPIPEFPAPDWVYVTADGPTQLTLPVSPGQAPVIGRYAYAVYDTGGLLDINVAGYPSALPASAPHPAAISGSGQRIGYTAKGELAFADLTQLAPGSFTAAQIDTLVGWRNYASARPAGSFPTYTFNLNNAVAWFDAIMGNSTGFLRVGSHTWTPPGASSERTDQLFLTRQELLDLWKAGGFPEEALQFLTTFSRALTAPSWSPSQNSSDMPTYRSGMGASVAYAGDADKPDSFNRNVTRVRFPAATTVRHYKDNGVIETYGVAAGDPVLRQRFSLAKLAWLGSEGPNAAAFDPSLSSADRAAAIYDCFGLVWDAARWRWNYTQLPATNVHIYTLAEVAAAGREPNFFELLRAGILSGSLGRDPGQKNTLWQDWSIGGKWLGSSGVMGDFNDPVDHPGGYNYKKEPSMQALQIGANIIDQADADSYPTAIHMTFMGGLSALDDLAFQTAYGVENLPYLTRVGPLAIGDPAPTSKTDTNGRLKFWVQPELWNPHQVPSVATVQGPRNFRAYAYGSIHGVWRQRNQPIRWGDPTYYDDGTGIGTHIPYGTIYFSDPCDATSPYYSNPRLLTIEPGMGVDKSRTAVENLFDPAKYGSVTGDAGGPNRFAAFYVGQAIFAAASSPEIDKFILPNPTVYFALHYQRADGGWSPYNFMARLAVHPANPLTGSLVCNGYGTRGNATWASGSGDGSMVACRPDPRTDRFSLARVWTRDWMSNRTMNEGPSKEIGDNIGLFPSIPAFAFDSTGSPYSTAFMNMWGVNDPGYPFIKGPNGTTGKAFYADPDGVVRYGDCYRANIPEAIFTPALPRTGDGCQLYHGNASVVPASTIASPSSGSAQSRRPVILNRPFRSVAEMGFAYRDQPYKTLDFWSPTSADAGLLDLFTTTEQPVVVAGQVNLNNAPMPVLKAIFAGATKNDESLNLLMSAAEAETLANALADNIADPAQPAPNGPYLDRSELATRAGKIIQNSFNTKQTATSNWANKSHAEAPIRALANVTNLRTWNLMVDVLAQTGTLKPRATDLGGGFIVQGERRYWLHIAIDRFTGKIIDQKLEAVYE